MIPSPGVVDREGAKALGVHSSQAIMYRMMVATTHFFNILKEQVNVFIPLEFKHPQDTRPVWRTATFSYLDGVWEWVQVTSDHVVNHYSLLANGYAAEKALTPIHTMVSSIAPPTECSLSVVMPSAQLSHKGGATTCPKGSLQNVKVDPGSSDPLDAWKTWEEYLEKRPGEITQYQIMAVLTQNQLKIGRFIAKILGTL